jgi:hypothetical protein
LDFGFTSDGHEFLVEMMRLEETDAVGATTTTEKFADGATMVKRHLTTTAEDPRQSEEAETLKAVERICQKFESGSKPHKFPPPDQEQSICFSWMSGRFSTAATSGTACTWDSAGNTCHMSFFAATSRENWLVVFSAPERRYAVQPKARDCLHFIASVCSWMVGFSGTNDQGRSHPLSTVCRRGLR